MKRKTRAEDPVVIEGAKLWRYIKDGKAMPGAMDIDVYEVSIYGGTHAEGFTSDGDVSGLTLLHSISGDADDWNSPSVESGFTKKGTEDFV